MSTRRSSYGAISLPTLDEMPDAPPPLVLPAADGGPAVAGVVVAANWTAKTPGMHAPPSDDAIDWPAPARRASRTTFEIGVAHPPRWGSVNIFHAVNPDTGLPADPTTGAPTEIPELTLDLLEFAGVEGVLVPDGDIVRLWALPEEMAPSEYVVVQLGWTAMRQATQTQTQSRPPYLPSAELDAAWAFRFGDG